MNPVRVRKAGKENLDDKHGGLVNQITTDGPTRDASRQQLERLEDLDFMYNQANAMALEGDNLIFLNLDSDDRNETTA